MSIILRSEVPGVPDIRKIVARMRNSQVGWRFKEIQRVLETAGFELYRVAGSHHVFIRRRDRRRLIIVRHGKDVKPFYVRQALKAIEA